MRISITDHETRWVASLSDGQTVTEGKGLATEVEGELSPWNKLQQYLKYTGLHITGMMIIYDGQRVVLPSGAKEYRQYRKVAAEVNTSQTQFRFSEKWNIIAGIYGDNLIEICVDELGKNHVKIETTPQS